MRRAATAARLRRIYAALFLLFLFLPLALLVLFSFNDSVFISFPLRGFTLAWYRQLFDDESLVAALANSLRIALLAALLSTLLAMLACRALTRYALRGGSWALSTMMAPLVIPDLILAVSLLVSFQALGLGTGLHAVVLGHVVICLPLAVSILLPRYRQLDPALEEASRDLGAGSWSTFARVLWPQLASGCAASLLLAFSISFDEFLVAFFLSSTEQTLPVYIWGQLRFPARLPAVLALGSIIIVASCLLIAIAQRLAGRGTSLQPLKEPES
jgi:spermidine/putrescine transport system permease protein